MTNKTYLYTSESVSEGHPDKIADQISDAIVDAYLAVDKNAKVACETLVTTGQVILAGEVRSNASIDTQSVARGVIRRIGYTKSDYKFDADSCGVLTAIHEQSADINRGVERGNEEEQGAGDQGMMFGYACNETQNYLPLPIELAHLLVQELSLIRKEGKDMTYLRPDSKSQVTVEYDAQTNKPIRVHTIVISTQHDEFISIENGFVGSQEEADQAMLNLIKEDVEKILLPRVKAKVGTEMQGLFDSSLILLVNPTGKFVIGGPHGDTGLTGRKIIVDTYGGRGAHGGGAFSGKDPSKVDRSAAYAARYVAKNLVAAGVADEVLVQVAYAIGVAKPVSICINTNGTAKNGLTDNQIAEIVNKVFDFRPRTIINKFNLLSPIYEATASYGHFGRTTQVVETKADSINKEITLFPWEKLDLVAEIKECL